MSCCTLENFGYPNKSWVQDIAKNLGVLTTFAAISGVVMGVLALYGVVPQATGLWTQVGLFGGVAVAGAIVVALSKKVDNKMAVTLAVITMLTLPVLFGSLGAINVIQPHNMLWAATSIFGGVVIFSCICNLALIGTDCCTNKIN